MRIVAGTLRGRTIDAPAGDGTRPTTDRVREALFSSLFSLRGGFDNAVVLDAFAGSGALGLEALSRGAARASFYERDGAAAQVCKRNVAACGMQSRANVLKRDVLRETVPAGGPFDMVFLDPPYAYDPDTVLGVMRRFAEAGSLVPGCIVVYEHDFGTPVDVPGFDIVSQKKYGKTAITIMKESV